MAVSRQELPAPRALLGGALLAVALLPATGWAQDVKDIQPPKRNLVLREQGSFFVGGHPQHVDSAFASGGEGNSMINQMYFQYQKPAKSNGQYPIVFVHGCCLSSKTWETTPDGRMGWYEYFTRKGFDTYMGDQVGRARSGFNAVQYNRVQAGVDPGTSNPRITIATDRFAWNVFRFGDFETKTPWPDERFPMHTVGVGPNSTLDFYKQVIPDLTATVGLGVRPEDPGDVWPSAAQMAKLARKLGGAILVGHSQSSSFPTRAALFDARGVKGMIQLETGCFGNLTPEYIDILKNIPLLIMEGDHYATPRPAEPCPTEFAQLEAAGGDVTYIHLPAIGIHGNSHMFMQDNNNLQIADIIIDWIETHVGPKDQ
jgi:pimeloyl-ACP methyl ester carboxylesterase